MKDALFLYINNLTSNVTLTSLGEKKTSLVDFKCNGNEMPSPQNTFGFQYSCLGEPQIHLNIPVDLRIIIFDPNVIMYLSIPFTRKKKKVGMIHQRPTIQGSLPSCLKS